MTKLTDNDKKFGPFTWGNSDWKNLQVMFETGDDEHSLGNYIFIYLYSFVIRISLPRIIQPYRKKVYPVSWDAETIARLGRNFYYDVHPRHFGFYLNDGHFCVKYGRQTWDSSTEKSWSCFLPWTQWRFHKISFYDTNGGLFWEQISAENDRWIAQLDEQYNAREYVPKVQFEFDDYDGKRIIATTYIEKRQWKFGEKWCKWLSFFREDKVVRSLSIEFSEEVGPEKGSWKGGTIGTGIDLLPGELHEEAFRRYCQQEQRGKYRNYKIKFIGEVSHLKQMRDTTNHLTNYIKDHPYLFQKIDNFSGAMDLN